MKTTLKQLITGTFIAFLLMVGNAKASELKITSLEANETTLQLENWMTDETIWNTNSSNIMEFVQETEADLQLENWMINNETWNTENITVEPELTIEPWMINNNIWE